MAYAATPFIKIKVMLRFLLIWRKNVALLALYYRHVFLTPYGLFTVTEIMLDAKQDHQIKS